MRIAISMTATRYDAWKLWRHGAPGKWTVIRTQDTSLALPHGFRAVERGEILPISETDLRAELDRTSREPYWATKAAAERRQHAEEMVRIGRGDPSHDWYVWVAPLGLTPARAEDEWVDAVTSIMTTHSHIVLRPEPHTDGWLAWAGLGSVMQVVAPPEHVSGKAGRKRPREYPGGPRTRRTPPAYWPSRAEALGAAVQRVRDARRELSSLLPGWDNEAREEIISGAASRRLVVFGAQILTAEIQVHEGPASGPASSWDLPIVETIA